MAVSSTAIAALCDDLRQWRDRIQSAINNDSLDWRSLVSEVFHEEDNNQDELLARLRMVENAGPLADAIDTELCEGWNIVSLNVGGNSWKVTDDGKKNVVSDLELSREYAEKVKRRVTIALAAVEQLRTDTPPTANPTSPKRATEAAADDSRKAVEAEFVFRPDGNGYFIRGFGEQGHVSPKGAKGLHDIFRLVQSPGVPVPMLELDAGAGTVRLEGDGYSKQLAANEMTLDEIRDKRNRFNEQIAEATDPNEQSTLTGQLKDFEEGVKGLFGKAGRNGKRTIRDRNNPNDKLRSRIHKRIRDACDSLENSKPNSFPVLAEHFRLTIGAAGACMTYSPGIPNLHWGTEPTSHPKSNAAT